MLAASWMTGHGVSSFSSYSAATGRITFSAKSWTHFCICSWSSLRSSEKSPISPSFGHLDSRGATPGSVPSYRPVTHGTAWYRRCKPSGSRVAGVGLWTVLQVRELRIEIGSRVTLEGASFKLRAGDKVGLVGRNGTGKTTMLKVIAGEAASSGGVVLRPDELGYLPQNPQTRGSGVDNTGLSHVLSGRGLDARGAAGREAAAPDRGVALREGRRQVRPGRRGVPRRGRVRGGVRRASHRRRPRAHRGPARPPDRRAVRW